MEKEKAEEHYRHFLEAIGVDLNFEHFKETPRRVVELLAKFLNYPEPDMKCFSSSCKGMLWKSPIKFYSLCPHHIMPIKMEGAFVYMPKDGKIVGVSKIKKMFTWCGAKFICQEDLASIIADWFMEKVKPLGCLVRLKGEHFCEYVKYNEHDGIFGDTEVRGNFHEDTIKTEALKYIGD